MYLKQFQRLYRKQLRLSGKNYDKYLVYENKSLQKNEKIIMNNYIEIESDWINIKYKDPVTYYDNFYEIPNFFN